PRRWRLVPRMVKRAQPSCDRREGATYMRLTAAAATSLLAFRPVMQFARNRRGAAAAFPSACVHRAARSLVRDMSPRRQAFGATPGETPYLVPDQRVTMW